MDLNQLEIYAKVFQSLVTGGGIIIGAIWAYYKFIKGRLFTPKIELALSERIIKVEQDQTIVALEIVLKNIGSVRLLPFNCHVDVKALYISNGLLQEDKVSIPQAENIMPFKTESKGIYYIDPSESSFRSLCFPVNPKYKALSVLVFVKYNKAATERVFNIDLTKKESSSKASGA